MSVAAPKSSPQFAERSHSEAPRLRVPHGSFLLLLVGFIATSWALDRLFGHAVSRLGLDNSTRALYSHFLSGAWCPIVGNIVLHWLPKAAAITALAWFTLRCAKVPPREALLHRLERRHVMVVSGALAVLAFYHWVWWRFVLAHAAEPTDFSVTFVGLYVLRFLPSAWIEEVTFRGVLFRALRDRYSTILAWPVALALFAAAHAYGGPDLIAHSLIIGVVLTGVYQLTGALWPCAVLHTASNLLHAVLEYRS
jgi:membrane protease YdiL (CAAX protease family)